MRWIVDNSVLQRMPRSTEVAASVAELDRAGDLLCSTPVSVLEAGYSVRSADQHSALVEQLTRGFRLLPLTEEVGLTAVVLQARLWEAGTGRAGGTMDLLLAASAVVHDAGVLHYDADFESLAAADERLVHRWVVPRGSVP